MCRHIAYLGEPRSLSSLLVEPKHSLVRQSYAPREQRHGKVNADGFGVGWYAPGDPEPARYRQDTPIWSDPSFPDLARVVRSTAIIAAVRSATAGTAGGVEAAAPFSDSTYLFSHNGAIAGWPDQLAGLLDKIPADRLVDLVARTDSALIWAIVQEALASGLSPDRALTSTVQQLRAESAGRLNLLLLSRRQIFATRSGDTLYHRELSDGVVVASEPYDDAPGWTAVPEDSVLIATPSHIDIQPIRAEM
ncbi:MAG TPA: ergothioneine biosynthesis protein EgtC [Actinomycetes bacterium]|nr:ergothioneine biosynthesis protein EgtC [Actinomycetes bacterium]